MRPKVSSRPEDDPATRLEPGDDAEGAVPNITPDPSEPATRSDPPESLRKPYAVLVSQRPPEGVAEGPERARSVPPRPKAISERRRVDSNAGRGRGSVCPKHQISRSPSGECLLCKKEEVPATSSRSLVRLALISLLAGGLILLSIYLVVAL